MAIAAENSKAKQRIEEDSATSLTSMPIAITIKGLFQDEIEDGGEKPTSNTTVRVRVYSWIFSTDVLHQECNNKLETTAVTGKHKSKYYQSLCCLLRLSPFYFDHHNKALPNRNKLK